MKGGACSGQDRKEGSSVTGKLPVSGRRYAGRQYTSTRNGLLLYFGRVFFAKVVTRLALARSIAGKTGTAAPQKFCPTTSINDAHLPVQWVLPTPKLWCACAKIVVHAHHSCRQNYTTKGFIGTHTTDGYFAPKILNDSSIFQLVYQKLFVVLVPPR